MSLNRVSLCHLESRLDFSLVAGLCLTEGFVWSWLSELVFVCEICGWKSPRKSSGFFGYSYVHGSFLYFEMLKQFSDRYDPTEMHDVSGLEQWIQTSSLRQNKRRKKKSSMLVTYCFERLTGDIWIL